MLDPPHPSPSPEMNHFFFLLIQQKLILTSARMWNTKPYNKWLALIHFDR